MKAKELTGTAARWIVGAVLVYAGLSKASAPVEEFALVIQGYSLVPKDIVLPLAGLLPWIEIAVGWSLLLGWQARLAASLAGGLFGAFLVALASTAARHIALPNCGCFGGALHFTIPQALGFDTVLALLCWLAFRGAPGALSLDRWAQGGQRS